MNLEIEVELKLPVIDVKAVRDSLTSLGATEIKSQLQYDLYLDRHYASFTKSDEALRFRKRMPIDAKINESDITGPIEITYKGPKLDALSKTRVEYTIRVEHAEEILELLEHLGFESKRPVIKRREYFQLNDAVISIDDVEELGVFVEIEKVVTSESEIEVTRNRLFKLAESLGLDPTQSIRESYLELLLSH